MKWTAEEGRRVSSPIVLGGSQEARLHDHAFERYHDHAFERYKDATPLNSPEGVECFIERCKCGAARCVITGPEEVLRREFAEL